MITRHVALLTGLVLLAAVGSARAHEERRYVVAPQNVNGSVTVWSGGHAPTGWVGSLSFGAPVLVGAPVLPVAAVPPPHWHGPLYGPAYHTVVREYARPWHAGYVKRHTHHPGRGRGRGHHD